MNQTMHRLVQRNNNSIKKFVNTNKTFQAFPVDGRGHKQIIFSDKTQYYIKCPVVENKEIEKKWTYLLEPFSNQNYYSRNSLRSLLMLIESKASLATKDINKFEYLLIKIIQEYPSILNTGLQHQILKNFLDIYSLNKKLSEWMYGFYFGKNSTIWDKNLNYQSILNRMLQNFLKYDNKHFIGDIHIGDILEKYNDIDLRGTCFIPYMVDIHIKKHKFFKPELIILLYQFWLEYTTKSAYLFGLKSPIPLYIIDHIDYHLKGSIYIIDRIINSIEKHEIPNDSSLEILQKYKHYFLRMICRLFHVKYLCMSMRHDSIIKYDLRELLLLKSLPMLKYSLHQNTSLSNKHNNNNNTCLHCGYKLNNEISYIEDLKPFKDAIICFIKNVEKTLQKIDIYLPNAKTELNFMKKLLNYHYIFDFNNYIIGYNNKNKSNRNYSIFLEEIFHTLKNSPKYINKNILLICKLLNTSHKDGYSFISYPQILEKTVNSHNIKSINVRYYEDDLICLYVAMKQLETILLTNDYTIPVPYIKSNDIYRQYLSLVDLELRDCFDTLLNVIVSPIDTNFRGNDANNPATQGQLIKPLFNSNNGSKCWHIIFKNSIYCFNPNYK